MSFCIVLSIFIIIIIITIGSIVATQVVDFKIVWIKSHIRWIYYEGVYIPNPTLIVY